MNTTTQTRSINLTALNPAYAILMAQASRQADSYELVDLGRYNGQRVYTNREGLYIGASQQTARKAQSSDLELNLMEAD